MQDIHYALSPWLQSSPSHQMHYAAGYHGPWLENVWIDMFYKKKYLYDSSSSFCLSDDFGGMIPLFIPWTDVWEPEG